MRFGEVEKLYFLQWMRRLERFCGVQVLTYCLMGNHFHLLVRIPQKDRMPNLDEGTLRRLLSAIYSGRQLKGAIQELDRACDAANRGNPVWLRELLERYQARRHDLSAFVGELKQHFTLWYNGRNQRSGTLWEDKFHSVLVAGERDALLTVAAYIDLNPVRAKLCGDPKDYRWSGYGEAVAGRQKARLGLQAIIENTSIGAGSGVSVGDGMDCLNERVEKNDRDRTRPVTRVSWRDAAAGYRVLLYGHGEERDADAMTGSIGRVGISRERVEAELARGGCLSVAEILRCRVRYFCAGGVIGSRDFVDRVFEENLRIDDSKRRSGARTMAGADWGGLRVLRNLQRDVFGEKRQPAG